MLEAIRSLWLDWIILVLICASSKTGSSWKSFHWKRSSFNLNKQEKVYKGKNSNLNNKKNFLLIIRVSS